MISHEIYVILILLVQLSISYGSIKILKVMSINPLPRNYRKNYHSENIENNIILITSGSADETVISTIGHHWNVKGIIIYCIKVDTHRIWAGRYKKLLLVTNKDNEVIEKIQHIEYGDVYFLMNGFTIDDVRLRLTDLHYYFSTNNPKFLIWRFFIDQCRSILSSESNGTISWENSR